MRAGSGWICAHTFIQNVNSARVRSVFTLYKNAQNGYKLNE